MPAIYSQVASPERGSSTYSSQFRKLVSGIRHELQRRDDYGFYDDSNPARYAFFAFFVAAIVIFIGMVCVVNAKRMKAGRTPVISSYLSPPSYHQSQVAYEGQTATNLPTYTPAPNAQQDVGYYDKNGNFIPTTITTTDTTADESNFSNQMHQGNGSIELLDTNTNTEANNTADATNNRLYERNDSGALPTAHTEAPGINDPQSLSDMSYKRPSGPPPSKTYNSNSMAVGSSSKVDDELPPYDAPEPPSQSHYKS